MKQSICLHVLEQSVVWVSVTASLY